MIVPARTTIFIGVVLTLLLLGVVVAPALAYFVLIADAALVAACWVNGLRLKRLVVDVHREERKRLQLGRETDFVYRIENRSRCELLVSLRQPWPSGLAWQEERCVVTVRPGEVVSVALSATPLRRGELVLPPVEVDVRGRFGLARRRWDAAGEAVVNVYPDLDALARYDELRRSRTLSLFGIHRQRMLGSGRTFEELREYLPDDDFRDVNWKATARHRRPMTNVYQQERSQDVLICIDCGRMMAAPIGNKALLDSAVDSATMLAHVVARQGDRAGLVLFRDSVELFLKPTQANRTPQRMVEAMVDVKPEPVFPSYAALVRSIRACHKRRSMVFIFTDLSDPQLAADLASALPLISRRHIIVAISLRDALLNQKAEGPASNEREVYETIAAEKLIAERATRAADLRRQGVQVLECEADQLTVQVLNKYLSIKARQLI